MQLEQQESFVIHGPQLEILGEAETKLPASAKKRPVAVAVLAAAVVLSVFGIGGVQLKGLYRDTTEIYTSQVDDYGHGIQPDFTAQADAAANILRLCEPILGSEDDAVFTATGALGAWNTSVLEDGPQPRIQYQLNRNLYDAVDTLYSVGRDKLAGDDQRKLDAQYDAFVSAQATLDRATAAYNKEAAAYNKTASSFPANLISGLWGVGEVQSFSSGK